MLRPGKIGGLVVALAAMAAMAACSSAGATDDEPGSAGGNAGSSSGEGGAAPGEGGAAGDTSGEGGAAGSGEGGSGGSISVTGGSGGQGPIEGCQKSVIPGNRVPASVLIVLDRSTSMEDDGKWGFAVSALKTMLKTADPELGMGILRFPEGTNPVGCPINPLDPAYISCTSNYECTDIKDEPSVPVAPLKQSSGQINQFLSATKPKGGTPTVWALKKAYAYMQKVDVQGDRYVLLVTDGEPSYQLGDFNKDCGTESELAKIPSDARKGTPQVRTFVIGAPGSEGADLVLSGIAQNGGGCRPGGDPKARTCHYAIDSVDFEEELATALNQIAGLAQNTCIYEVPKPNGENVDPNFVNVSVDTGEGEEVVPQDAKQEKGWNYTDDSKTKIEIFGEQCEAIKASLDSKVNIVLGCATVVVPIG